jgi:hypothetical protein
LMLAWYGSTIESAFRFPPDPPSGGGLWEYDLPPFSGGGFRNRLEKKTSKPMAACGRSGK